MALKMTKLEKKWWGRLGRVCKHREKGTRKVNWYCWYSSSTPLECDEYICPFWPGWRKDLPDEDA